MSAASCCGLLPRIPSSSRRGCSAIARRGTGLAPSIRTSQGLIPMRSSRSSGRRARRDRSCLRRAAARAKPAAGGDDHRKRVPFVDLGADFRLDDAATYERWYGHKHGAPELLGNFVYGIPELNREAISGAKAVAAAGCYATAAILALKPLVDAGLVEAGKPDRRCRVGRQRSGPRSQGSDRLQHGRRKLFGLWAAQSSTHGRDGNGDRRDGAVHAAPGADDPRHPRDLLRRGDRLRRSAGGAARRPMPPSRSSTSPTSRRRPNG